MYIDGYHTYIYMKQTHMKIYKSIGRFTAVRITWDVMTRP